MLWKLIPYVCTIFFAIDIYELKTLNRFTEIAYKLTLKKYVGVFKRYIFAGKREREAKFTLNFLTPMISFWA